MKILVCGPPASGKSSLLAVFNGADFDHSAPYVATRTSDLVVREVTLNEANYANDEGSSGDDATSEITAPLWDVGGPFPLHQLGKSFLRGTQAVMLVVDLSTLNTNESSSSSSSSSSAVLSYLDGLYDRVRLIAGFAGDDFPCCVVGSKLDLLMPTGQEDRASAAVEVLRRWGLAPRPSSGASYNVSSSRSSSDPPSIPL